MFKAPTARMRRLILVLAAAAAIPSAALATHSWGGYHWARSSNPVFLLLGDNVSQAWDSYLATASAQWNASTVLHTTIDAGETKPKPCKPVAGRIEICSARYGFNGWLGIAQIWTSSGHIVQATTKMNDSYFNTAKYNTPGWRTMVMCQEVGHTFGLDHQDEDFSNPNLGTCMDYTSKPEGPPSNLYPNAHDYEELEIIYSHLDGYNSTAQFAAARGGPPAAAAGDEAVQIGTAQWGRLIRSTNGGRTETFQLDLDADHKVFTFVIWADPEDQPAAPRGRR